MIDHTVKYAAAVQPGDTLLGLGLASAPVRSVGRLRPPRRFLPWRYTVIIDIGTTDEDTDTYLFHSRDLVRVVHPDVAATDPDGAS